MIHQPQYYGPHHPRRSGLYLPGFLLCATFLLTVFNGDCQAQSNVNEALDQERIANDAYQAGNFHRAGILYSRLSVQQPGRPDLNVSLARCFHHLGLMDDAEQQLKRALKVDSNYVDAWLLQARIELSRENWRAAKKQFERVMRILPDNPFAYLGLGSVYSAMGDFDQSHVAYERYWSLTSSDIRKD